MNSTELVVGLLGGGGIAAIVSAVVAGLFSKKKLSAEATSLITQAATGVVTKIEAQLDRSEAARERMVLEHRRAIVDLLDAHEREVEEVRRVLQLHVAWDAMAVAKLAEHGIELPPAPPLLPPLRPHRPNLDDLVGE